MNQLKRSVQDTVNGLNAYVNQLDKKKHAHIFIMAIQFYLMNDAQVQEYVFQNLMFGQPFNFGDQGNQGD